MILSFKSVATVVYVVSGRTNGKRVTARVRASSVRDAFADVVRECPGFELTGIVEDTRG